jgi:hypothetical protein
LDCTPEARVLEADLVRLAIFPVMLTGAVLIWRSHRHVIGRLLTLIGTLHLGGVWVARDAVRRIVTGGILGQADSAVGRLAARADQELVFWFALFGVWTIFLGQVAVMLERRGVALPRWFGWQLLIASLMAATLAPKDGFWWLVLPAVLIIRGGSNRPSVQSTS